LCQGTCPDLVNSPIGVWPRWCNTQRYVPLCGSRKEIHLDYLSGPDDAMLQLKREGTGTVTHFQEKQGLQECTGEPHSSMKSGAEKTHFDSLISDPAGCKMPFWLLLHWARLDSRGGECYLFLIKHGYLLLSSAQSVFIKCQIQATYGGRPPCPSHSKFPARPFKALRCETTFFFFFCNLLF